MHILYHKNKVFVTHHSYFFTYYPLRLFYLVWRSSDYKHLLCRIRRWSPIQFTMCTSLLINLFDCLTSCRMIVYKTKPLTLLSIQHIKGYMHQTYTPPQKIHQQALCKQEWVSLSNHDSSLSFKLEAQNVIHTHCQDKSYCR